MRRKDKKSEKAKIFRPGVSKKRKTPLLAKAKIREIKNLKWKSFFDFTDNSSIAAFRILFGLIVGYDICTYIFNEGWIFSFWVDDIHHFTYWPFDFVEPLPGIGMYILFGAMAILCLLICIGLFYRVSIFLFWLFFTYVFLIEETVYLNHFYLIILVSFVMIFIPANRSFSLDALIFKKIRSDITHVWNIWLLRFMIGLPYFFGAIAKMKSDWLHGEPMRTWLYNKMDFPIIGSFFRDEWMIYTMSYSGLLLDLIIVPALLIRRTRLFAFAIISIFHIMNSQLFIIAVFPWLMIAATTIYFDPDWFRTIINTYLKKGKSKKLVIPSGAELKQVMPLKIRQKFTISLISLWVIIHCMIPLRHYLIPGNVLWTEEGYYFAWHMMLRSKKGVAVFTMVNKQTGERKVIVNEDYLTSFQRKKVFINPKLAWEFCNRIKGIYGRLGFDVAVYADIKVSLNGRPYRQLIDPNVDLTMQSNPVWGNVDWILSDK